MSLLGQRLPVRRGTAGAIRLAAGLVLAAAIAARADVVSLLYPVHGEDQRNRGLMEKTRQYLAQQLPGHEFRLLELAGSQWMDDIDKSPPGLVLVDPVQYIRLESRGRILPVVAVHRLIKGRPNSLTAGVLFGRRDSAVARVEDAKGLRLAYVDGDPLAAWLSIRYELHLRRLAPDKLFGALQPFPSDQAVVEAVLQRKADIGAVEAGLLEQMAVGNRSFLDEIQSIPMAVLPRQVSQDYPLMTSTHLYPGRMLAALPGLPPDLIRLIAATLISATPADLDPEGRTNAGWTLVGPLEPARQALKEMRAPPYERYGELSFGMVLRQYMYWFIGAIALFVVLGLVTSYVLSLNRALEEEINERQEAQDSLKTSNERFEHMAACSGDWIWETDVDERFTYSSDALKKLLGYDAVEILGKSFLDILSSGEKERMGERKKLLQAETGAIVHRRVALRTADGRVATHDCTAGITRDKEGRVTGYRGVNRDVTAEARMVSFR